MTSGVRMRMREQGSALVAVTVLLIVAVGLTAASLSTTQAKVVLVRSANLDLAARYVAEAGVQLQINSVRNMRDISVMSTPFTGIDAMDSIVAEGVGNFTQTFATEAIVDGTGATAGEVDVAIDVLDRSSESQRSIAISSIGYVPSKAAFFADERSAARIEVKAVIRLRFSEAEVFDYSYFINHWGWFYGDTIIANGNVRANGQFDFGGYGATINGNPRYESAQGADLIGYQDDNNDGVTDGSDGGVYSGWSILAPENLQGMGADPANRHEWQDNVPMPNLSDLTVYESLALSEAGTISVGGSVVASGIVGDDPGESQNLFLVGTATDPVILNGPVVVRGDVVISGVVQGQGSIYAGRNAYVPQDITYRSGPSPVRPVANDEATVEAWRSSNQSADALGLFAREHVVIGDYTDSTWQQYVSDWVAHNLNESAEDAGADGVQNTSDGIDGVAGTTDDDVLEGDGVWTVDYYTAIDAAAGAIPPGFAVGDVVPGSGEDLDGDGQFDGTTQMTEFETAAPVSDPSQWEGNLPSGTSTFSDVASIYISQIDSNFYTNHTFAALMLNWGGDIVMNGSIVSRNESIIYGANSIQMNHDARLLGRDADSFGLYLPLTWSSIETVQWSLGDAAVVEDYIP